MRTIIGASQNRKGSRKDDVQVTTQSLSFSGSRLILQQTHHRNQHSSNGSTDGGSNGVE
jgi:hypothetical protein